MGPFNFLLEWSNADGAILFLRQDGSLGAWIVECKRTVKEASWKKARMQMKWTLARLRAIAGVLRLPLSVVTFGTAFRVDQLSPQSSPNPALGKQQIGPSHSQGRGKELFQELQKQWLSDCVCGLGDDVIFRHFQILLDAKGNRELSEEDVLRLGGLEVIATTKENGEASADHPAS